MKKLPRVTTFLKWLILKKLPKVTTFNMVLQEPSNDYKYVTMTRISKYWLMLISQHLSKSFCSTLALSIKVHWTKTCVILFSSSPPFLQKDFQETTLGDCFQEKVFLVANTEHKGPTFLGFIARSRICFLVDHWIEKTNVFWVHCKKWV